MAMFKKTGFWHVVMVNLWYFTTFNINIILLLWLFQCFSQKLRLKLAIQSAVGEVPTTEIKSAALQLAYGL